MHLQATVEVDVMPFLGRTSFGGPFDAYSEALSGIGASYVRFSPWYPNPRVVVPELRPSDCTPSKPATNWNSTMLDDVVRECALSFSLASERLVRPLTPRPPLFATQLHGSSVWSTRCQRRMQAQRSAAVVYDARVDVRGRVVFRRQSELSP